MAFLFWAFNSFGGVINYPFGNANVNSLSLTFQLTSWGALLSIGGSVLIGIASLLLKVGTYAIYAMLLFAIGVFLPIVQSFVLAIPNTIAALVPESTNPMPGSPNPIAVVVGVIVLFAGFMFIMEMVTQRKVS